jgi:anti-anti-sigma factor
MQPNMQFTFSDTIAGYVTSYNWDKQSFSLDTSDGRSFDIALTPTTSAEGVRNFGEDYVDYTGQMRDMLVSDRYVYVYGSFYPEGGKQPFEAERLIFLGKTERGYRFEEPDWWVNMIRFLGDFWLKAQFPDGIVDYRNYRTRVSLSGIKLSGHTEDFRQETDTISRLVYGFATAYLMTGEDRFLEAAEKGTEYLRDHLRSVDESEGIAYWYHAIDVKAGHERKILASDFGDDYDAIPMYEQIYALAGPTQTYRVTGDPRILHDIEMTMTLFDRFFLDREQGGYFSHVDPVTFDPRSEGLGRDRARKNWNSVGDHAPAYLINLWLATGDPKYADMLVYVADTIEKRFPDDVHSLFVQERFHEDWSSDTSWGWQQDRAVVGHNLKIAWNLIRIDSLRPNEKYVALARKIAAVMPAVGSDRQRGGWYDVVERRLAPGQEVHRFVWHDRKAWWQQEQAILAYFILAGSMKQPEYLRLARESASFYNAWFLDHDDGGIYFNVLASGLPYLLGNERLKGSHSMSGYHSFELAYLAAVYTNLLITKQPMDFYFKPLPGGFKDNILRIQPDILPAGSVRIGEVWVDGAPYADFDADALTIKLPVTDRRVSVQVRMVPAQLLFNASARVDDGTATVTLTGKLDAEAAIILESRLAPVMLQNPDRVELLVHDLQYISSAGVRALVFAKGKLGMDASLEIVGAQQQVRTALEQAEFAEGITFVDEPSTTSSV